MNVQIHPAYHGKAITRAAAALACIGFALSLAACSGGGSGTLSQADVVGVWGQADSGEPSLEFADDGSFSGTDGCNRLMGSYELAGMTIELGDVAMTRMACPDVEVWLVDPATATIAGNSLEISDGAGTIIGTLDRQ